MSGSAKKNSILGLLAAGLLTATALTGGSFLPSSPLHAESSAIVAPATPQNGFADMVAKVMPAVISVDVKYANVAANDVQDGQDGQDDAQPGLPQLPENSPFRDFFKNFPQFRNMPNQDQQRPHGGGMALGSGFIISPDGYAVTNNHVVQNADEVTVKLNDDGEYQAQVIGTDPKTDLALIKIKSDKSFQYVKFSNKEPRVGDWAIAVGNPFGLGGSVTVGVISARSRDIGSGPYDDFLQIDASINRGNSGGPTFDQDGNVVGVNTAIYSPSGGSVGIGFAIPASTAQDVIQSLKEHGTVTRGWLGVQIQGVTPDIAESLKLTSEKGAVVADVTEKSPALAAGVKTGDTITKVNGEEVSDPRDLAKKVARIVPGKKAELEIVRNGKVITLSVEIAKMPGDEKLASAKPDQGSGETSVGQLGLTLAPGNDGDGVAVTAVKPGSKAEEKGLKTGDVILEVSGKEVHTPSDVRNALASLKAEKQKNAMMLIRSGDSQRFITMPVNENRG